MEINSVTTKIQGYPATATEPLTGLKGRSGNAQVAEKSTVNASGGASAKTAAVDHVTLTDSAVTLQKLSAAVASTPVIDASKVASVKQAVQSGTYQVNPASVANKILGFESGLKPGA
ncbi:MAG: flagellar biosynthesis anti-sigma factor FlgM [Steroidobacterales bacterium]